MILSLLISFMISFGFISSESDYDNLNQTQIDSYEQIIIDDVDTL
ncbi:MAG: hypothetical protein AB8H03_04240 [Saprospiraceae bacterium]